LPRDVKFRDSSLLSVAKFSSRDAHALLASSNSRDAHALHASSRRDNRVLLASSNSRDRTVLHASSRRDNRVLLVSSSNSLREAASLNLRDRLVPLVPSSRLLARTTTTDIEPWPFQLLSSETKLVIQHN
jgi:hypothetical protein